MKLPIKMLEVEVPRSTGQPTQSPYFAGLPWEGVQKAGEALGAVGRGLLNELAQERAQKDAEREHGARALTLAQHEADLSGYLDDMDNRLRENPALRREDVLKEFEGYATERSEFYLQSITPERQDLVRGAFLSQATQVTARLDGLFDVQETAKARADVQTAVNTYVKLAVGESDPSFTLAKIDKLLDESGALAGLKADDVATAKREARAGVAKVRTAEWILRDPRGAFQALREGKVADLDPEDKVVLQNRAEAEVNQREAERRRQFAEAKADARSEASEAIFAISMGQDPGDIGPLMKRLKGLGLSQSANRLQKATSTLRVTASFAALSYPEQVSTYQQTLAKGDGHTAAIMEKILDETRRDVVADPLGLAAKRGLKITPLNLQDPIASLRARERDVRRAEAYYGKMPGSLGVLTADEAQLFVSHTSGMTYEQKAAFLGQMRQAVGAGRMVATMRQLSREAPTLAIAGSLVAEGAPRAAMLVLKGQTLNATLPKDVDLQWEKESRGALTDMPEALKATKEAVEFAYAAKLVSRGGKVSELDKGTYHEAFAEVTGGIGTRGSRAYFLPRGMAEDEMEGRLRMATKEWVKKQGGMAGLSDAQAAKFIQGDAALASVGDGKYKLVWGNYYLSDKQGRPFVLDIKSLPKAPPYLLRDELQPQVGWPFDQMWVGEE